MDRPYGAHVRVVSRPAAPPSCDIVVLAKEPDGTWVDAWSTNDMSNDFALTDAASVAYSLAQKIKYAAPTKEGWWKYGH